MNSQIAPFFCIFHVGKVSDGIEWSFKVAHVRPIFYEVKLSVVPCPWKFGLRLSLQHWYYHLTHISCIQRRMQCRATHVHVYSCARVDVRRRKTLQLSAVIKYNANMGMCVSVRARAWYCADIKQKPRNTTLVRKESAAAVCLCV